MKKLLLSALLLALFIPAGTAYAYDTPSQGTDNATDIILWYGDNLTIESATVSGEIEITGLTDSNESIAGDFLAFIIVAFIIVIALTKDKDIIDALACPVSIIYGFTLASGQTVYSQLWVAGIALVLIGLYFLFRIVIRGINKRKAQKNG